MSRSAEDCSLTGHRVPIRLPPDSHMTGDGEAAPLLMRRPISRLDTNVDFNGQRSGTGMLDQNTLIQFLPLVLIFVVFYFLLIRPQQRKAKDQKAMLDALRRGDRVVTGGGIIGTVARVDNPEEVIVDIADGVRVRVLRGTITSVLAKPDPAAAREAAKQKEEARAKAGPGPTK